MIEVTTKNLEAEGYLLPRQLDDGTWIAIGEQFTTYSLLIGLDEIGYAYRYCYKDLRDAVAALLLWQGQHPPAGPWIVRKGLYDPATGEIDLYNPDRNPRLR